MSAQTLPEVLARGYGVERSFLCPVHGDSHPSASVNTLKMVWVCYTCGAHGKVGGEVLAQDIDLDAVSRYIKDELHVVEPKTESWLNVYDSAHPYWYSRFSRRAIEEFRLGFDYEHDAATYPLRNNAGAVLDVVRRSMVADASKYKYPRGIDVSTLLFDYHHAGEVLVLTEGATDAIACWEAGVQACAVYGSRFSEAQALLVRRLDPKVVLCAFDMDQAGYGASSAVAWRLPEYRVGRITWDPALGDLAKMSLEIRKEILWKHLELKA